MQNKITESHDELVDIVMKMAREYDRVRNPDAKGDPRPFARDGIDLYAVGHNASHHFYLGVKDGVLHSYAIGEDDDPWIWEQGELKSNPKAPKPTPREFWPGYYGHF